MRSTRLGPRSLAITLGLGIAAGACAKSNNAQLAELQMELRAERELLRETRAELQAMMIRLEPLLAMVGPFRAAMSGHVYDGPPIATAPMPTADVADLSTEAGASDGIAKTGPTQYQISRTRFEELLGNPTEMARGARFVPSIKNGKGDGFKLYAIRPSSVFAKIGLENGDTIHRCNGVELHSLDKAMEVYSELRTATRIEMELTRRGQPITLRIAIH